MFRCIGSTSLGYTIYPPTVFEFWKTGLRRKRNPSRDSTGRLFMNWAFLIWERSVIYFRGFWIFMIGEPALRHCLLGICDDTLQFSSRLSFHSLRCHVSYLAFGGYWRAKHAQSSGTVRLAWSSWILRMRNDQICWSS